MEEVEWLFKSGSFKDFKFLSGFEPDAHFGYAQNDETAKNSAPDVTIFFASGAHFMREDQPFLPARERRYFSLSQLAMKALAASPIVESV